LEVHIFVDGVRRAVAAESRLLEAAERRRQRRAVERVDPYRARLDRAAEAMGGVHVGGPDRGAEAVDAVIGEPYRLRLVLEGDHDDDGAEYLFLRDAHVVARAVEDGRLD